MVSRRETIDDFAETDKLFGCDEKSAGYQKLKERYQKGEKSPELLWRLARFSHEKATNMAKDGRLTMINEGLKYAEEGVAKEPTNFNCIKWNAILLGLSLQNLPIKQRVEQSKKFKALLDKAIGIQPTDTSLLHLRGRYKYSVASLTWLERKVASAFFGTPPTHTFGEALEDFMLAHKVQPKWIENQMYIAKCGIAIKNKDISRKYLKDVIDGDATSDSDTEYQAEAKQLLSKL